MKEPVPAYLFFAPSAEISVGFLEAQTLAFYRIINQTGNVTAAFESTLGSKMESFHCQGLFLQALLNYVQSQCNAKQRQERADYLLSAILKRDGIANPSTAQLKSSRSEIKRLLKPGQPLIDLFASRFLIGGSAAFTFEDIQLILARRSLGSKRQAPARQVTS